MKLRLLLLSALLSLSACRHLSKREPVPTPEEIQRTAPAGGLVRVILRDKDQPHRVTTYLVDVRQDKIVDRSDGPTSRQLEGQESDAMKSTAQANSNFLMATVEATTDCKPPEDRTDCAPDPSAWNGDPRDGSGGGGDPTGHDPDRLVRNLAAYSFWSIRQVRLPYLMKPVQVQNPTHR